MLVLDQGIDLFHSTFDSFLLGCLGWVLLRHPRLATHLDRHSHRPLRQRQSLCRSTCKFRRSNLKCALALQHITGDALFSNLLGALLRGYVFAMRREARARPCGGRTRGVTRRALHHTPLGSCIVILSLIMYHGNTITLSFAGVSRAHQVRRDK